MKQNEPIKSVVSVASVGDQNTLLSVNFTPKLISKICWYKLIINIGIISFFEYL